MNADKLAQWVEAHKVPAAAIGGVGLAGAFAVVQAIRSRGGSKGATSPNTGTYFVVPGAGGFDGFNSIPAPDTPYIPKQPDPTAPDSGGSSQPIYQAQPISQPAPPATMNPLSLFMPPQPTGIPLALPQIDTSRIYSEWTVANPVGSTDAAKLANQGTYNPSLTDYATERPGGVSTALVAVPGGPAGASYTVNNTGLGSGPVVPEPQRIAGERYDQYGRVIA